MLRTIFSGGLIPSVCGSRMVCVHGDEGSLMCILMTIYQAVIHKQTRQETHSLLARLVFAEVLTAGFQNQSTLKASHDAAMMKVDELTAQLKDERMKSLDLEKRLQSSAVVNVRMKQVSAAGLHGYYTLSSSSSLRAQGLSSSLFKS